MIPRMPECVIDWIFKAWLKSNSANALVSPILQNVSWGNHALHEKKIKTKLLNIKRNYNNGCMI